MKVREVVQRTRLWKHEKLAVARELIAHFQDGLAAGSGVEELLGSFGDTKMAAKLIRRGKKRNRPLWWRAQRRGLQVMAAVMVVYIGSAMLLALRHPQVRRDFVAELNQPEMAVPPQERGWSIYARAWERVHIQELNTDVFYVNDPVGSAMWRHVRLGDSQWPAAVAFLRQHREFLDLLREAAGKKVFGWELRWGGMSEEQLAGVGAAGRQQWRPPTPRNRAEKLLDESMISVLLPYISPVRQSALLLASDMRLAASEGDTARVLADYRAITGIARQLARTPIVVQQLVALGIMAIGDQTLMTINSQTPEAMTECRVELLHTMASAADPFDLKLSGERSAMLDMIQRIYSDDGHGNGAPTLDGTKLLAQLQGVLHNNIWERSDAGANALHAAALPAVTLTMGSREDATQEMERFLALSAEEIARPLWVKLHTPAISERLINDLRSSWTQRIRYPLLTTLAPSLKAGISFDRGRAVHEAATVALSLEAYRAANGSYPEKPDFAGAKILARDATGSIHRRPAPLQAP